jgi:hypothetical protein
VTESALLGFSRRRGGEEENIIKVDMVVTTPARRREHDAKDGSNVSAACLDKNEEGVL